jgi:hypothetical protein
MHSQSSAAPPDTLGFIVRQYLKALRPEFSESNAGHERPGRRAEEIIPSRKNSSVQRVGGLAPDLGKRFIIR